MNIKMWMLRIIRKIVRLLFKLEIEERYSIKIREKPYQIPVISGLGYSNINSFEPWMETLLLNLAKLNPTLFIDVGVNVGQTLLKVKSCFQDINYIGFEPNPACVYYVNELIKLNNMSNTKILPVGLSDASNLVELQFYSDAAGDSSASIVKDFRHNKVRSSFVPVFSPDVIGPLNEKHNGIQIVKIDVEGAEYEVIKGLQPYIAKNFPIIIMEILPIYNSENYVRIDRQKKLLDLMTKANYLFYRILKTEKGKLLGFQLIQSIEIHSDINKCEYIFIPESISKKFSMLILDNSDTKYSSTQNIKYRFI